MIARDSRKSMLRTHYKQDLSAFHKIDAQMKKLTNDALDTCKYILMRNN